MLLTYLRARKHKIPVTLTDLLGVKLRKGRPGLLVDALITTRRANVPLTLDKAELHALAGGDIQAIAAAAAILRRQGETVDLDRLCAIDLCGLDVRKLAERRVDLSHIPGGVDPGPEFRKPRR